MVMIICRNVAFLKVLDQIKRNHPQLFSIKTDILISKESSYFSDYCGEILGPKYVTLDVMNKKVTNFTKVWLPQNTFLLLL